MSLSEEVARFRKWADEFEDRLAEWETYYPDWDRLRDALTEHLAGADTDALDMETVLYVLARDNECETALEWLASNPDLALQVAKAAFMSTEEDARWQAAVALGSVNTPEAVSLLRQFTVDSNEYVRRRAHIAIRSRDPSFAEQQAIEWLEAPHEYSRMVAVDTLAELGSPYLPKAILHLREDDSSVVTNRIRQIESEGADA